MTYTEHGYHIHGTPNETELPVVVAKCGGPGLCRVCNSDAIVARLDVFISHGKESNGNSD